MQSLHGRVVATLSISALALSPVVAAAQPTVSADVALARDAHPLTFALSETMRPAAPLAEPAPIGLAEQTAQLANPLLFDARTGERREAAAERSDIERPLISEVIRRVVLDPTTYAPAAIVYSSLHLDWKSSQPLFRAGYVESHSGYTRSGLAYDEPVDYAEGRRRNRDVALRQFGRSLANNAVSAVVERMLIEKAPRHRKLIRVLGWIERTAFASYFSWYLSEKHFAQWKKNEALARQVGAR